MFFSRARWSPDLLGVSLSHLIVRRLLPEGAVLTVVADDTLVKRRGEKVFGAAWQHDGAAKGPLALRTPPMPSATATPPTTSKKTCGTPSAEPSRASRTRPRT